MHQYLKPIPGFCTGRKTHGGYTVLHLHVLDYILHAVTYMYIYNFADSLSQTPANSVMSSESKMLSTGIASRSESAENT